MTTAFAMDVERLLSEGRTEAALELAADGLRAFPTYIGGYALLVDCYVKLGHLEDAKLILDEADLRFANREVLRSRRDTLDSSPEEVVAVEPVEVEAAVTVEHEPEAEPVVEEPGQRRMIARRRRAKSEQGTQRQESPLRIIEFAPPSDDARVIRSSTVRLIPGLEYTSLRFEGSHSGGERSINRLPQPPAFRTFNKPVRSPFVGPTKSMPSKKVSLEELADKINRTRLNAAELGKRPPAPDPIAGSPKPSLVTETLAQIYMQQNSFDKAIEAFRTLAGQQPDKAEHFRRLIEECIEAKEKES
jgi:tetratricopeptide (TPR) repeat protein